MSAFLLDVNVLVALMWTAHGSHLRAQEWFARNARHGWATCPLTQAGFVRIISNPAFSPDAVTPREAAGLLHTNLGHRHHKFWADDIPLADAIEPLLPHLLGHRQITDAYLLGLAKHHRARLATMDRAILLLLPDASERDLVELIL